MEKPDRSQNTPGTDAAFDLLSEIAVDPANDERYPDGTVLIPADSPDASALISLAVAEHRPLAIVYPDGREIVAAPRGGALAFFEHLLTRRRESKPGTPAVPLPADTRSRSGIVRRSPPLERCLRRFLRQPSAEGA